MKKKTEIIVSAEKETTIQVDASADPVHIDSRIYGNQLEEMARIIDDGIIPKKSLNVETGGFGYRKDVWDACFELKPTVLRWPGGCFADTYHWRDGVGEPRRVKPNLAWRRFGKRLGPNVNNRLGTVEFLELCRDWNAIPYITANFGSGTVAESVEWLQYILSLPKEYPRVDLWAIGNEQFGFWETGHTSAKKYAKKYIEYSKALKETYPAVETVASGVSDMIGLSGWNPKLMDIAGDKIDYLSIHPYKPMIGGISYVFGRPKNDLKNWRAALSVDYEIERIIDEVDASSIKIAGRRIPLAIDEWGVWWYYRQIFNPICTLRDALASAAYIMAFIRRAESVKIANFYPLVNQISPAIITREEKIAKTPAYYALRLFSNFAGSLRIPLKVSGPTYNSEKVKGIPAVKEKPIVDGVATLSGDGYKIIIYLLNRDPDKSQRVGIEIAGAFLRDEVVIHYVTGPSIDSENIPGKPETVTTRVRILNHTFGAISLEPRSLSAIVFDVIH